MSNEPFVIERTFNAPSSKVWQAITDKEQMKEWYFDLADFKAEPGFQFQFEGKSYAGSSSVKLRRIENLFNT